MYDLHRLGWNSFQQLCLTIAREVLGQTVQSFLDSNDAGRDGAFTGSWTPALGQHLSGKFVIQCKFSSKGGFLLTKSDMADEIPKVRKLVSDGLCDVYILMTNAGVSGKQEAQIRSGLIDAGVQHVLIYGATWIEGQIKENTRLRMLVPRVYGLGDLSQILDERAYAQARAVLESLREDLAKVVITDSYRKAVSALDEHGFVLLVGEPAAGKTTIASMLAMAAADKWKSSVLKLADPAKVVERWNVVDPLFTKDLYLGEYHLGQFVEKREQLLLEVIQGLDANSKAALGLIYMRKDHLESPITLQGAEPQALERLRSTLGECITALDALNGSLVTNIQIDDQLVWRFKHPTIGDAYAVTLALSPDLLGIFLSGSSTENLISQVTCGNVGVEKAVVVPKSLFPMMVARLREFSASDKYKVQWMSAWGARWKLYRFLASRCSKEFLEMYLEQDPDILKRVSDPGLSLSAVPEVDLAVRLHGFGLLPEGNRQKFIEIVGKYAIEGEDVYALDDAGVHSVFTDSEFDELVETVRMDLLPKLADVRKNVQKNYDSSDPPDEHMQNILESFSTLKKRFREDEDAVKIIERETDLANEWIAETEPPEAKIAPRTLGIVEPSEKKHGTRSIFDDIDDGDA